jgi:hypothetical protein
MDNKILYIYTFITLLLCNVTGFAQVGYPPDAESELEVSAESFFNGDSRDIWSSGSIISTDIVYPGAQVHYKAAKSIEFTAGFQAFEGSIVIAEIETMNKVKSTESDEQNIFEKGDSFVDQIVIYPNPSNGFFNIETSGLDYPIHLNVYDYTGKVILNRELRQGLEQIDLSFNLKGIYIIKLDIAGKVYTNKITLY